MIEIAPLAYMRGRTLDDSFIILDEAQNTTREQMKMFLTRIGFGSKVVITGDITQIDLPADKGSGLREAMRVLKGVEDIGICLGKAFAEALGDKKGIIRYGDTTLAMDESLILTAVDISGRGGFYPILNIPSPKVGDFDTELCQEFWIAFARDAALTLHLQQLAGSNSHHIIEGAFKSIARSLRTAVSIDAAFADDIMSTKGVL